VAIEDDGLRWGACIAAEEAGDVDPEDIQNFSLDELQDSCQVKFALMEDIESVLDPIFWLQAAVVQKPNARRTTKVRQQRAF
jgi:hypothetical protein